MGKYSNHSEDELSNIVLGIAIEVHSILGPGLLENVYKQVLFHKLTNAGIMVEMEKNMPILIDDLFLDLGYKMDLLVENKLVLELKSVKEITNVHVAQVINYLKLGKFKLGLILNFNVYQLKSGIKRVILTEGPRPF
ncbi:GxxExxY protein [Algoriphagus sp.]|jgi:GxxExxY protein|uniref:GxxExxY protein n=1 Tax=Algoriphagus sp. TaxID=1872435 RepID=UPI00271ADCB8|nr:GxxExxY protein [Algoriphagus sp.]MDO8965881.1 GxxExxY protein [Algoriphagus sp.]MDP3201067.1 GxxExxY protein [Algoriphagus sp.]